GTWLEGMASMTSRVMTRSLVVLCTSTMGVSPVTVIVSATAPTFISALMVTTNAPVTSTPSRLIVLNPASVSVTLYTPGGRLMNRYCPDPSVTTERVLSMSTGLANSTVTPGRTAFDVSLTTPVIDPCPCAYAAAGTNSTAAR